MAGTGTLAVTPGTGATVNTLPPSGQSTSANSLPIVVASDQTPIPVANAALGTTADSTPANPTISGSIIAKLSGIWQALITRLQPDTNGNLKVVMYDSTGAAVTYGNRTLVDTVVSFAAASRSGLTTIKAVSAAITAGGSSYAVGDTITNAAGVFTVSAISSGAVTAVTVTSANALTSPTSGALSQTATSGSGTGCTLTPTYAAASATLAAANASRRGFSIQNQSNAPLWFSSIASATPDNNSIILQPGDYFESSPQHVGPGIISIIGQGAGQAFYAREF